MKPNRISVETEQLIAILATSKEALLSKSLGYDIVQEIHSQWGDAMVRLEAAALLFETEPGHTGAMAEIKRTLHTIKAQQKTAGPSMYAFHEPKREGV